MPQAKRTLVAVLVLILCAGASANAGPGPEKKQLAILSASVNRQAETLTLNGLNFGQSAPTVLCETTPMTVLSATDSQLVVLFPAAVPDGTYLFTVARGPAQVDRDVFYVTTHAPVVGNRSRNAS